MDHLSENADSNFDVSEENSEHFQEEEKLSGQSNADGGRCPSCDLIFPLARNLKSHLSLHEREVAKASLTCQLCLKTFRSKDCAQRHQRLHNGEKPFKCETCGEGFNSSHALSEHELRHTNEKPHSCPDCGLTFRHLSSFRRHSDIHRLPSATPYLCNVCSKTFTKMEYLKKHSLVHTGERRYLCPECPKRYLHSSDLIRHRKVHTGLRPYECPVCSMRFNDVSSRGRHLREHKRQPLSCTHCNRTFKNYRLVRSHITKQHAEVAGTQKDTGKRTKKTISDQVVNHPPIRTTTGEENQETSGFAPVVNSLKEAAHDSVAESILSVLQPNVDFVINPDFESQSFYDWLSQFASWCKLVSLPMSQQTFTQISQVQKTLMDSLATPSGVLENKDNFGVILIITADLQKVLNAHLTAVFNLLQI